jgi:hypothetical protein
MRRQYQAPAPRRQTHLQVREILTTRTPARPACGPSWLGDRAALRPIKRAGGKNCVALASLLGVISLDFETIVTPSIFFILNSCDASCRLSGAAWRDFFVRQMTG